MSEEILRIVIALIAVLGMIGGAAMLARRMGFTTPGASLGGKKRLALVETMTLDARRRIAIIKCDDTEHLIILSASSETVIASDIDGAPQNVEDAESPTTQEASFPSLSEFTKKLRPTSAKNAA